MILVFKIMFIVLIVVGIGFSLYGAWEMWGTKSLLTLSTGTAKAKFSDYYREYHESTSTTTMPDGTMRSEKGMSVASYPEFTYQTPDGTMKTVRESKVHVFELYKPGQEIDIVLFDNYQPRIAGFYSLYVRDLLILILGLGFILLPAFFWKVALPKFEATKFRVPAAESSKAAPAGTESSREVSGIDRMEEHFKRALNQKVGPFSVKALFIGFAVFMGSMLIMALVAGLIPYIKQLGFGPGGRLIKALNEKQSDKAREMISGGSGINAKDEYDRNPLLIALETGQTDLARMLIDKGADVNIKSKMILNTPLLVATYEGDIEMVKLLLSKGASPDAKPDERMPFAIALQKKRYDIARVLIEGGMDLQRVYREIDWEYTAGDLAVLSRNQELVELIHKRGGSFTR